GELVRDLSADRSGCGRSAARQRQEGSGGDRACQGSPSPPAARFQGHLDRNISHRGDRIKRDTRVIASNTEIVHRILDLWRGLESIPPELLAPDIQWVNPADAIEGGTR